MATLLAEILSLNAQETFTPRPSQFILPSPTSQTYNRFMGYQPNLATGAVNVNIPLTTLDWGAFTLPLTLSYQSNGIKPTDTYNLFGYGWMLQPGLRITRTIIGKPDDMFFDRNVEAHYQDIVGGDRCYINNLFDKSGNMADSQYDVFTICLPGGNTSFVLKNTYKDNVYAPLCWGAVTVGSPLHIEVLQNARNYNNLSSAYIHGFKITDENGVVYYFGNDDRGISNPNTHVELSSELVPTTYLLRKIILPGEKKENITFGWRVVNESVSYTNAFTFTHGLYESGESSPIPGDTFIPFYQTGSTYANSHLINISSDRYSVSLPYSDYINYITVENGEGTVIKDVRFSYADKLMQQVVIDGVEKYSFDYNPKRFEYATDCWDFWGYYNGKHNDCSYPSYDFKTTVVPGTYPRRIFAADMMPDPSYMDANILEKITYPTGGTTTFEYEPHKYQKEKMDTGGGLRVKRMVTDAHDGSPQMIKTYEYGNSGYGLCTLEPNEETYITQDFYFYEPKTIIGSGDHAYRYGRTTIHPSCVCGLYFAFNLPVWYPVVTEHTSEGKNVYRYEFKPDELEEVYDTPYQGYHAFSGTDRQIPVYLMKTFENIFDRLPRMTSKETYDRNGKEVFREEYRYMPYTVGKNIRGIAGQHTGTDLDNSSPGCNKNNYYTMIYNTIFPVVHKLQEKKTIADGVTKTESYIYTYWDIFLNLHSVTTIEKDGKEQKIQYLYAYDNVPEAGDSTFTGNWNMQVHNRVTQPLRIKKWTGGKLVSEKRTDYYKFDHYAESWEPLILPVQESFMQDNGEFESRITSSRYSHKGNVQEMVVDGKTTSYIWGYSGNYPIARIENVTYAQIESLLGVPLLDRLAEDAVPSASDAAQVNDLRTRLPQASVTTYTYLPGVGVASETSPVGQAIYYDYDRAQRLIAVYRLKADAVGGKEMIESYEYKYQ